MFSDRFEMLCANKGVKPGRACLEMGLSRSLAAKWKATKTERPSVDVLEKMSKYFDLSTDEILEIKDSKSKNCISDADIKAAFWGGEKDLSKEDIDELWRDVQDYAAFKAKQKKKEK